MDISKILAAAIATAGLSASVASAAAAPSGPFEYSRHYSDGEELSYHFRVDAYDDGFWTGGQNGVAKHKVTVPAAGAPSELVSWIHYSVRDANGETPHDELARAVSRYALTLADGGSNDPSPVNVHQMTDFLSDYAFFYKALHPRMGVTRVREIGDAFINTAIDHESWSHGDEVFHGESAFSTEVSLIDLNDTQAYVRVAFSPPASSSVVLDRDFMKAPVAEKPNNWVNVTGQTAHGFEKVAWGSEEKIIVAQIDRATGKINWASMMDVINERSRSGCDQSMTHCAPEISTEHRRTFHMGLSGTRFLFTPKFRYQVPFHP